MTIHEVKSSDTGVRHFVSHPLDPLTAEEIATASRIPEVAVQPRPKDTIRDHSPEGTGQGGSP